MTTSVEENARAIFLPAFDTLNVPEVMDPFLEKGGHAVLIGESRQEYVARAMSTERLNSETEQSFRACIDTLKIHQPHLIVAVDQELGGIRRLQGLVPDLPTVTQALSMSDEDISEQCFQSAVAARALGVSLFLAPIVDVVDGTNPWLENRTMGRDPATVARLAVAFIRGVQRAGITAVTKHFPGYNNLFADPALVDVTLETTSEHLFRNAGPFRAAIQAGTRAIMTGPAPVRAIDVESAASTSAAVMAMLRRQFAFTGLIVSDDLDAPATMRGRPLLETAIASVNAGADLLLVAGGPHLDGLCSGIADAARSGRIAPERLADAAGKVRAEAMGS